MDGVRNESGAIAESLWSRQLAKEACDDRPDGRTSQLEDGFAHSVYTREVRDNLRGTGTAPKAGIKDTQKWIQNRLD